MSPLTPTVIYLHHSLYLQLHDLDTRCICRVMMSHWVGAGQVYESNNSLTCMGISPGELFLPFISFTPNIFLYDIAFSMPTFYPKYELMKPNQMN